MEAHGLKSIGGFFLSIDVVVSLCHELGKSIPSNTGIFLNLPFNIVQGVISYGFLDIIDDVVWRNLPLGACPEAALLVPLPVASELTGE